MTRITVADTILKAGEPWGHTPVRFELVDSNGDPVTPAYVTATGVLVEAFTTTTNADGTFTVQLDPTDAIAPTGCYYGVTIGGDVGPILIRGDQGDGSLRSLRASTPTVLGSTATLTGLADVDITGRVDGSVLEWDTTTGKWIMGTGGGGGAPTNASYLVLGTDATLTDERVLTAGTGITFTDAGAGSTLTVKVSDSTYQPLDSDLTAIAALSTTSFGRALLELADAAAGRTALGLGSLATASTITTAEITDGTIVNADISASAAIATSKISGLGGAATLNVGTTAGTVAAGDDSRITGAAQKASNLSDLANAKTARSNLSIPTPGRAAATGAPTYYYSVPGAATGITPSTLTLTANRLYHIPLWVQGDSIVIDQIAFEQTTAAAAGKLIRVGLYAATSDWQPTGSPLEDSGSIAADGANGVKTYTPSGGTRTLTPGMYVLVVVSDGAPILRSVRLALPNGPIGTTVTANAYLVNLYRSFTYGSLPTAAAWDTTTIGNTGFDGIAFVRITNPSA